MAVAFFVVALAAGVSTIGHESLWFDEAVTVRAGRMGSDRFLELIQTREPFWALYYSAIRPWMTLGDSAAALRLPSALAAALTVSLTYLVGRRLVGQAAAVTAGAVLVIHAYLLHYAQEARGYTLAVSLISAATLAFVLALEKSRWWTWAVYAVLATAAVYAHFYAAMVIAGHAFVLLVHAARHGWSRSWIAPAVAMSVVAAASLPLAIWLANEPARAFANPVTFERLITGLAWMAGVVSWQRSPVFGAMVAVMLAVIVIGAFRLLHTAGSRTDGWRPQLVVGWLLLPLAISLAISLAVKPAFTDKYLILSLPAVALAIGAAVTWLPRWPLRLAAATVVAGILVTSSWSVLSQIRKPDWNAAAEIALRDVRPGDVVFSQPVWQWTPLEYAMDHCTDGRIPELRAVGADEEDARALLDDLRREGRRIWLMVFDYRSVPLHASFPHLAALERGNRRVLDEVVNGVRVMLYEPDLSPATPARRAQASASGAPGAGSRRASDWFQASHCSTTSPTTSNVTSETPARVMSAPSSRNEAHQLIAAR